MSLKQAALMASVFVVLLPQAVAGAEGPALWAQVDRGSRISDEGPRGGAGSAVLYYPINRLHDLMDMLGLQVGFGFGLHANFHATRAVQFGGGASGVSRVGFEGRGFGMCTESKAELSLLPFTFERFARSNALGTYDSYSSKHDLPWLYHKHRDYWGIGGEFTGAIINVGFELHPLEVPDFLAGLATLDPRHDDLPQPPLGEALNSLRCPEALAIKTVVMVPSRVIAEPTVRMARADGLGVYYHRFTKEARFGRLGSRMGRGPDAAAEREFNAALGNRKFDLYRELLERVERVVYLRRGWKVVDHRKTCRAFEQHAVTKSWGGLKIRRLPNYPGLAQHYGADAVLDVRVWEWGVWRNTHRKDARMRLDCEFKLIAHPSNQVLLDLRLTSEVKEKPGFPLAEFVGDDGRILVDETRDAIGVVTAAFADIVREAQ